MAVAFDTLKAATRLREEAGFDEKQATALVQTFADRGVENLATREELAAVRGEMATREDLAAIRGEMATREDLAAVRAEMATREELAAVRAEMATREDLAAVRSEMATREDLAGVRGEITVLRGDLEKTELALRGDMEKNVASLRGDMHKLEQRMTMRLGTVIAAGVAIVVALDKLL